MELLGVTIDNEIKFNQHISRFSKSAGCQLNALFRLKNPDSFRAEESINRKSYICKLKLLDTDLAFLRMYIHKQNRQYTKKDFTAFA